MNFAHFLFAQMTDKQIFGNFEKDSGRMFRKDAHLLLPDDHEDFLAEVGSEGLVPRTIVQIGPQWVEVLVVILLKVSSIQGRGLFRHRLKIRIPYFLASLFRKKYIVPRSGKQKTNHMKRVTGIGGIFFKTDDPEKMKSWYGKHLGIQTDQYGGVFRWKNAEKPDQTCYTAWSPFSRKSTYFAPSEKEFMFNYRVEDLEALLTVLKEEGVTVVGEIQSFSYGKFGWILDPEGNKIELWEPIDKGFGYDEDYGTA